MPRITSVKATGSKFGQHGDHRVTIEVALVADPRAMNHIQYYPEWVNELRRDKHHRVDFNRYDSGKCAVTYRPEIVFADERYERWQLRKLDDLKVLALRYATELEAEARRIEPMARKAEEVKAMLRSLDSRASVYVSIYPTRGNETATIEINLTAGYEYDGRDQVRTWRAPEGFDARYRDVAETFNAHGHSESEPTMGEFLRFDTAEAQALYQCAIDALNANALWEKVVLTARRVSTPQASINASTLTGGKGELVVWFPSGAQKRREFETMAGVLDYLESHDIEAVKADFGYVAPTPGETTSAERAERARRAAERKVLADAKAKLEADWKAIVEAASAPPKAEVVDAWDEESEQ